MEDTHSATPSQQIDPEPSHSVATGLAAAVMLLGAVTVWASLDLGYWTNLGPGAGFFPLWLGVFLGVLGLAWLVRSWRAWQAEGEQDNGPEVGSAPEERTFTWPNAIAIVGSLVVLTSLLEVLGYQLAMLLFLMFHLKVLGRQNWLLSIGLSLAGSIGVFLVFTRLLTVNLPAAGIPFLADLGL